MGRWTGCSFLLLLAPLPAGSESGDDEKGEGGKIKQKIAKLTKFCPNPHFYGGTSSRLSDFFSFILTLS
jgi:hypothetical protein